MHAAGHAHHLNDDINQCIAPIEQHAAARLDGIAAPIQVIRQAGHHVAAAKEEASELVDAQGIRLQRRRDAPASCHDHRTARLRELVADSQGFVEASGRRSQHEHRQAVLCGKRQVLTAKERRNCHK